MEVIKDYLIVFAVIGGGLSILIGGYYYLWEVPRTRKRASGLTKEAGLMGFSFEKELAKNPRDFFGPHQLFKITRASKTMVNTIKGELPTGVPFHIFDYGYSMHPDTDVEQTVGVFELAGADLLPFVLYAKAKDRISGKAFRRIGLKVSDMMTGFRKIDLPSLPSRYDLRSPEHADHVKRLFDDSLLNFFSNNPGWHIEGGGRHLLIYRFDILMKPQDLRTFVSECRDIAEQFTLRK